MNKKITIAMLMVMLMACTIMFAGCYVVEHTPNETPTPTPPSEKTPMEILDEFFTQFENNNYKVEVDMLAQSEGISLEFSMEMAFDANVSYLAINFFGITAETYYEFTEENTVWCYALDEEEGWVKYEVSLEEYNDSVLVNEYSELFVAENFVYVEEDGVYVPSESLVMPEGTTSFVLKIDGNNTLTLSTEMADAEGYTSTVNMTFCDFGKVELTLPEAKEPDALEVFMTKLFIGNATVSMKQTNVDGSVITSAIKCDFADMEEFYEININGEIYYVAMNYGTDEYFIYSPDGEGGYVKEETDYFGIYDITEQVAAYSYITGILYEDGAFVYSEEEGMYVLTEEAAEMFYEDYTITSVTIELKEDGSAVMKFVVEGEFEAEIVFSDVGSTSVEIPA